MNTNAHHMMDHIIECLVEAGYFRARISTLSDFDKIIGGMAWAMQVFSYDININVFYTDTLDLGQKIGLTERLVMVLLVMKCPYRLEPHQIVGLDYGSLLPAIRWLIKRSAEVRREQEAFNRLLALRHYHRIAGCSGDAGDRSRWCHVVPISHLQKFGNNKLEFHDEGKNSYSNTASDNKQTQELLAQINERFKDNQQVSFVQLASVLRANHGAVSINELTKGAGGESGVQEDDVMSDHDEEVEEEPAKVNHQLAQDEDESQMNDEERRLQRELDLELLATNQKILNLMKRIDLMPSQLEICQYQRRYIELHQQLISKNKDVKKLFDLYNSLDVTKHYLVKEINLLDSIESQLELTTNSASNRELFMKQFGEIINKIQQIRSDMQVRLERLRKRCDLLNAEYAQMLNDADHDDD